MNVEQARFNMVEQQVRTWDVLDQRVLRVLESASRDAFVPPGFRDLAYADVSIPLGHGEVMLPPRVQARVLQSLALDERDRVLEIGTGSGFLTHLLAALAGHVFSMEWHQDLAESARERLTAAGTFNVTVEHADGAPGRPATAPYDAIAVTGSVPELPAAFKEQLAIGGRAFVVVGEAPAMEASLITRVDTEQWSVDALFETVIPPLHGIPMKRRFTF